MVAVVEMLVTAIEAEGADNEWAGLADGFFVEVRFADDVFATAVLVGICGCSDSGVAADSADSIPCIFVCDNVL